MYIRRAKRCLQHRSGPDPSVREPVSRVDAVCQSGPNVGTALAADRAHKSRRDIRKPRVIRPAIRDDCDRVGCTGLPSNRSGSIPGTTAERSAAKVISVCDLDVALDEQGCARADGIFFSDFEQREIGPDLFRKACEFGVEGLVSKHRESIPRDLGI